MHRLLIFLAGCAFGYVIGGYVDGLTGDDEYLVAPVGKRTIPKSDANLTGEP